MTQMIRFSPFVALILILASVLSGCGGESRTNPHNPTYDYDIPDVDPNQGNTSTTNNQAQTTQGPREYSLDVRNFHCDTGGGALSTGLPSKYVMAGNGGHILTSQNALDWLSAPRVPTSQTINDIVKGRDVYLAVGNNGTVLCSPNGYDWFSVSLQWNKDGVLVNETNHLYAVATNGNQFVIVGANGALYTNKGTNAWERNPLKTTTNFYDVIWAQQQYVVVGGDPDAKAEINIMSSLDGVTWSVIRSSTDQSIKTVRWTGKQFIAAGSRIKPPKEKERACTENCKTDAYLYVSSDGYDWSNQPIEFTNKITNSRFTTIAGVDGDIVALGHGYHSENTSTPVTFILVKLESQAKWIDYVMADATPYVYRDAIVFEGSQGKNALVLGSSGSATKLAQFPLRSIANNLTPSDVYNTANGMNVIVDNPPSYPANALCPVPNMRKVVKDATPVYYGSMYVAVGERGLIYASQKGDNWEAVTSGTTKDLNEVIRRGNAFYVVGDDGALLCSRNGFDWHSLPSNTETNLSSIATDGKTYVAVGENGLMLTSVNGVQWDVTEPVTSSHLKRIIWDGADGMEQFIVIGGDDELDQSGFILRSDNGIDWESVAVDNDVYLNDIAWNGFEYIVAGYRRSCNNTVCTNHGYIAVSEDGIAWESQPIPTDNQFSSVEFTSVVSRGNEIIAIGRGSVSGSYDVLIEARNTQQPAWDINVFSDAQATGYNDALAHDGDYWFVGENGVVSTTSTTLSELNAQVVGNLDLASIAINGEFPSTARIDKAFRYAPVIRDPDGQRITLALGGAPNWMKVNSELAIVTGTPTETDLPNSESGELQVSATVEQKTSTPAFAQSEPYSIRVVTNNPPQISGTPIELLSVANKESYGFVPSAYDPDGEKLTFYINTNGTAGAIPAWAQFDSTTGALYGTPTLSDRGSYNITIGVDDNLEDEIEPVSLDPFLLEISNLPIEVGL